MKFNYVLDSTNLEKSVLDLYNLQNDFCAQNNDIDYQAIRGPKAKVSIELLKSLYYKKYKHVYIDKKYHCNNLFIRHYDPVVDKFNDVLFTTVATDKDYYVFRFTVTTVPSKHFLDKVKIGKDSKGRKATAILKEGQYSYKLGSHFGYEAGVQGEPVWTYRDINRDGKYDFTNENRGWFGIHIHKSDNIGGLSSAGCLTFRWNFQFYVWRALMNINNIAKGKNHFFLTLVRNGQQ